MPRYKLTVAYEGTHFHGWQKQHPPDSEPLRTVQGELEAAVHAVVREQVHVLGASRTDAGVHAHGQVAAFNCEAEFEPDRIRDAISSRLPEDVQVLEASVVPREFDPIQDCVSKGYRYRLAYARRRAASRPLFDRRVLSWTPYELDVPRMHEAAGHLVGEHDFASFTRVNHGRETTVRTIDACSVVEDGVDCCRIEVSGNGFLYNMVRIIAGTLLEVGRGRIDPDAIPAILERRDRAAAGPTLPPEGLCLMWIEYGEA